MGKIGFPFGGLNVSMFGGTAIGVGSVYVVVNAADSYTYAAAKSRFGSARNPDGTPVLFVHSATASAVSENGIKEALAYCQANRDDTVIILPSSGSYYTDEALSISKETVHLVAPTGLGPPYGSNKSVRIAQITAATAVLNVSANYCEVAGLWMKNYYSAATVILAAAQATNLHHNYFALQHTGGTNAPAIYGTTTGGAWGQIYNNWIISQAGNSATCAAVILIDASATSTVVSHNMITCGDGNTFSIGISNQAVKGMTNFNIFNESSSSGGYSGGTISAAISISPTGGAIGNRGSVASGHLLAADGTTNVSYSQNFDGQAGGATAVTT
jgi:hypothetical protein